jgi:hypothetical protein
VSDGRVREASLAHLHIIFIYAKTARTSPLRHASQTATDTDVAARKCLPSVAQRGHRSLRTRLRPLLLACCAWHGMACPHDHVHRLIIPQSTSLQKAGTRGDVHCKTHSRPET